MFKLDAWFYPHVISNILSLAILTKHYPVSFHTMEKITIHLQYQEIKFKQCEGRIYYFDTAAASEFYGANLTSIFDSTPDKTKKTCLLNTL